MDNTTNFTIYRIAREFNRIYSELPKREIAENWIKPELEKANIYTEDNLLAVLEVILSIR